MSDSRESSQSRGSSRETKKGGLLSRLRRISGQERLDADPLEGSSTSAQVVDREEEELEYEQEEEERTAKKGKGKSDGKNSKKGKGKMKVKAARKVETESESSDEEDNGDPHHVSFTKASPLGRILLGLVADNLALQEKAGIRESNVSARALCSAFHAQMQAERQLLKANIESNAVLTE